MKLNWRAIREDLLPFACCKHCHCRGFFKIGHPVPCAICTGAFKSENADV